MQDLPAWLAVAVAAATLAWTIWYTRRKAERKARKAAAAGKLGPPAVAETN